MSVIKKISLLLLMTIVGSAYAAKPGVYVGLGAGASHQDTPDEYLVPYAGTDINQSKPSKVSFPAGKAFIGYNFNQYFGIEGSFLHFAQAEYKANYGNVWDAKYTYDLNALNLVGKGYLPIADTGLNFYGLAGASYAMAKQAVEVKSTKYADSASVKTNKLRPLAGAGISYDFADTGVSTSLEYNHLFGKGDTKYDGSAIPSADLVTFNLAYNFG